MSKIKPNEKKLLHLKHRANSDLRSSVEMQTSTMSEPNGMLGGNMTCDRPLRELTGVPDESEETEEVEPEP